MTLLFILACDTADPPLPPDAVKVQRSTVVDEQGEGVELTTFQREAPDEPTVADIEAGCSAGDLDHCRSLGGLQQGGADYEAAEGTWSTACEAGNGGSCADLANLLANPFVERGKEAEAPPWAAKACALDQAFGCYMIGAWTRDGRHGLSADPAAAKPLLQKGCTLGHYWACEEAKAL